MNMMFSASYLSKLESARPTLHRDQLTAGSVGDPRWRYSGYEIEGDRRGRLVESHPIEEEAAIAEEFDEGNDESRKVTLVGNLTSNHNDLPTLTANEMATTQKSVTRAPKTYSWISLWFLLTAPVIAWDVSYCFLRPHSMKGGSLHWIWSPYAIYQEVDHVYGLPAFNSGSGFTNAQSLMNVVETLLNLYYLYQAHISQWSGATLVGFTSAALTLAKTLLYWLQEYFCGYCAIGHNTLKDLVLYWIIPNGLWIVVPALIVYRLGKDLVGSLEIAAKAKTS